MLRALLLPLIMVLAVMATAQNLVPNPSFEDTVNCSVQVQCDLLKAAHWLNPNLATPDVYDCDLDRQCGQPMDPADVGGVVIQGYQFAHHGMRFAAAFQWYGPGVSPEADTREYLMARLTEPMVVGRSYAISLFYSRAEGYQYAIDHLGVYFGLDSLAQNDPVVLDFAPQVVLRDPLQPYLLEGDDWVQLTDTFVASGGEQWMVVGTFEGSDQVNGIEATPSSFYAYAYYYIDQVSVVPLDIVSVPEWTAWYSGSGTLDVHWHNNAVLDCLRLLDGVGKVLMDVGLSWVAGTHSIDVPGSMAGGVYVLEGWSNGRRSVTKFVKQ